jgi:osmotically-inducible protein OsmY
MDRNREEGVMGRGIELLRAGIVVAALVGGSALALGQTPAEQAGQEAAKAGQEAKQATDEAKQAADEAKQAADEAKQAGKEAEKAAKERAETETKEVEEAGKQAKEEIDRETEGAKKKIDEAAKGQTPSSPAEIEKQLDAALDSDTELRGSAIEVTVDDAGVATLSGTVPNDKVRSKALKRTKDVKGVTAVDDQLQVGRNDPR